MNFSLEEQGFTWDETNKIVEKAIQKLDEHEANGNCACKACYEKKLKVYKLWSGFFRGEGL